MRRPPALLSPTCLPVTCLLLACLMTACGGTASTAEEIAEQVNAAREPAEARVGDLLLRASIAPTAALGEAITSRYGVQPDPRTVLLLAGVRRIDGVDEVSVPATLSATARDLRGVRQTIAMNEVRLDGFIDHVGEVRITPPDTLGFEIVATTADGSTLELRFNREVFPAQR